MMCNLYMMRPWSRSVCRRFFSVHLAGSICFEIYPHWIYSSCWALETWLPLPLKLAGIIKCKFFLPLTLSCLAIRFPFQRWIKSATCSNIGNPQKIICHFYRFAWKFGARLPWNLEYMLSRRWTTGGGLHF